ncbi:MAG: alpha,alpha-trehalose-phosphate synthase (UDP-forming), partial [Actinomycetota bacterium]
ICVALVSNRGPVSFIERDGGGYDTKRGAGGLAGALDPVARRLGERAVWIAAATSDTDRKALADGAVDELVVQLGYRVRLLDIDPETYSLYYDVVSNRMMWFANHCLWDEVGIEGFGPAQLAAWTNAYEPVNQLFAQAVADVTSPDWFVLFQDYHLTTAPEQLRRLRPDQTILHFTHSSFCGPRGLEHLPGPIPPTIVKGMLGADLLGFHVARWAEGFFACCSELGAEVDRASGFVTHGGRRTWVRTYPIPIDAQELERRAAGPKARKWAEDLGAAAYALVVRADRAEPSKNVVRGFEAFGLLLDRRPDIRARTRFVACMYASRQSMPEYQRYLDDIQAVVDGVNARHPSAIELFIKDDYDRTLGALTVYDVLLVNPIMDGMNLVSKEGPALNERSGVLVLSRGAGSFDELGEDAIEISDPTDVAATAAALERALDLPAMERERRAARLRAKATARRPDDWIDAQIEDLVEIRAGRAPLTPPPGQTY